MKRVLLVLLGIVITIFFEGCSSKDNLNGMFNSLKVETEESVPYICYDNLVYNDMLVNFNELLEKNGINGVFHEVYVIQNDTIWFGYSDTEKNENGARQWNIATVDISGKEFNIAYSGEFCFGNTADRSYSQKNNSHQEERYITANGFYHDGKIILTDHVKMIELDVETTDWKEIVIEHYKFPVLPIETEIIDYQTITFSRDSEQKIFNVETGKRTSVAFEKLFKLEKEKTWQGKSYLSELFDKVQIVNNHIYIICRVINWDGETHAVVFQYDFENNSCKYAFHCFMDDLIGNDLYVVQTI